MRMLDYRPTDYLVVFTEWAQKSLIAQAFMTIFCFEV
jgi:hypothetical protein